jgi:hypothetical protein
VLFVALGLLIVCLAIIVVSHEQREMPWGEMAGATAGTDSKKDLLHGKEDSVDMNLESIPVVSPDPEEQASYVKLFKEVMGWGRTPIKFYGRVVDEGGRGIPEAEVKISINDTSPGGTSIFYQKSDGQGRFVIRDVKGKHLYIETSKEGYYDGSESYRGFQYAGVGGNFSPDPNHPEIFRLHKMGERVPLVESEGEINISYDRVESMINLFEPRRPSRQVDETVTIRAERSASVGSPESKGYRYIVSVPDGGLIEIVEEFSLMAPESGYQSEAVVETKRVEERKFFVRFKTGNYGRISIRFIPGAPYVRVHAYLNPDGSRNLEPDTERRIQVRTHLNGSISLIYPKGYEPKTP